MDIKGCPEHSGNECRWRFGIGLFSNIKLMVNITDHDRYIVGKDEPKHKRGMLEKPPATFFNISSLVAGILPAAYTEEP